MRGFGGRRISRWKSWTPPATGWGRLSLRECHGSAAGQLSCALGLAALLSGFPVPAAAGQSLTVVSWGGSYGRAVNEGANIPFTEATGIRISVEDYNGGLAQVRAQVEIGNIHWDVVDVEIADAVRGCDEGLFEPIDIDDLPPGPDGTLAADDFASPRGWCGRPDSQNTTR